MTKWHFSSHLDPKIATSLETIVALNEQDITIGKTTADPSLSTALTDYLKSQDQLIIIGCDEVGRGCIFGPVVGAASCIGSVDYELAQLTAKHAKTNSAKARFNLLSDQQFMQIATEQQAQSSVTANPYYKALGLKLDLTTDANLLDYVLKDVDSKKISEAKRKKLMHNFLQQAYSLEGFVYPSVSLDLYYTLQAKYQFALDLTPIQLSLIHNAMWLTPWLGSNSINTISSTGSSNATNSSLEQSSSSDEKLTSYAHNWLPEIATINSSLTPYLTQIGTELTTITDDKAAQTSEHNVIANYKNLLAEHHHYLQIFLNSIELSNSSYIQAASLNVAELISSLAKPIPKSKPSLDLASTQSTSSDQHIIVSVMQASASYIDQYNILKASLDVMTNAVLEVIKQLQAKAQALNIDFNTLAPRILVVVDGNQILPDLLPLNINQIAIVKGDSRVREISVASIAAKVYRDELIIELAQLPAYNMYGLTSHKGYPTKAHTEQLKLHGVSQQHRKSYGPVADLLTD